jgi:cardiolipin synthase
VNSRLIRIRGAPDRAHSQRRLAEQAFSRAAGAPLVPGNQVRLLRDATENFPAWLDAISRAKRHVFMDMYIFSDDKVGRPFAEALAARARAGVKVRVLWDWLGTWGSRRLWTLMREAGVEVRCFNPPKLDSPFGWVSRDHRKSICVDGEAGFVSGLCLSARWLGRPEVGVAPWRDTGIEIRGPAVADIEEAFARVWATAGPPLADEELAYAHGVGPAGDVPVRVVATMPHLTGLFRLDQLIASLARERLWLTDAYFVGLTPYVQALCAAARDGVDVRLLIPGASDIPVLSPLSRAGYRPLLESGVRVFEWNGTMLHAKTAVADDRWARVGSTNLNVASFWANYELDVAIEDQRFAGRMADMYEDDLDNATEIVLAKRRVRPTVRRARAPGARRWRPRSGSAGRAAAGALSLGSAVGAAMTNRRVLGPAEARVLAMAGLVLLALAAVGLVWPWLLAMPMGVAAAWVGVSLLMRSLRLYVRARRQQPEASGDVSGDRRAFDGAGTSAEVERTPEAAPGDAAVEPALPGAAVAARARAD